MIYHSVAEIFAALDESHARFAESVGQLGESDQLAERPMPDGWSIAEIVEHVAIVDSQIAKLAGMMLHKATSAGAISTTAAGGAFAPVSVEELVARSHVEKYRAPETAVPRGGVSIRDSLARISRAHETLKQLRPSIEATDGTAVNYPHPAFGALNLYQWLVMVAIHKDRHAGQIAVVKETISQQRRM